MPTTLTYTAGDMCQSALEEAGVADINTPVEAAEMTIALKRLNMMLKAWQNTSITVWKQTEGSIPIVAASQSYTISARPLSLDVVNYTDATARPMEMMTRRDYFELPDRATAGEPTQFYYHRQREQGVLYVWPVLASATGTLDWVGRSEVADISSRTDTIEVPSEWYEAVHYGLARRLAGHFSITDRLGDLAPLADEAYRYAQGADTDGVVRFVYGDGC